MYYPFNFSYQSVKIPWFTFSNLHLQITHPKPLRTRHACHWLSFLSLILLEMISWNKWKAPNPFCVRRAPIAMCVWNEVYVGRKSNCVAHLCLVSQNVHWSFFAGQSFPAKVSHVRGLSIQRWTELNNSERNRCDLTAWYVQARWILNYQIYTLAVS